MIRNVPSEKPVLLKDIINIRENQIISKVLTDSEHIHMTVLAFDAGEGVSSHAVPGDALVVVLEGEAIITIDGRENHVGAGDSVVMPAGIPHAVKALTKYKMLLTVVKE